MRIASLCWLLLGFMVLQGCSAPQFEDTQTPSTEGSVQEGNAESESGFIQKALSDSRLEASILILGDNTAKTSGGWVYLTAQWISAEFSRPVALRTWSVETAVYSEPLIVGSGSGLPVQIWNAATPARNLDYTVDNFSKLADPVPAALDLVIFDHGHNEGARTLGRDGMSVVSSAAARWPSSTQAVVLQNDQRPDIPSAKLHGLNVLDLKTSAAINNVQTIDVREAFARSSSDLLDPSGIFPNIEGFRVWSGVVERYFSLS